MTRASSGFVFLPAPARVIHRHLTDAIFPFFIIQQTIIVIAGHYLVPLQLQPWIKANVLIAITSGSC